VGKMRMYRAADGVRSVAQKTGERRPPNDEQKSKQGKATKNYEVEGDTTRNSQCMGERLAKRSCHSTVLENRGHIAAAPLRITRGSGTLWVGVAC